MMQPGDSFPGSHHSLHPHSHMPMDLHMAQGFQYYRYGHGTPQDYHLAAAGKPTVEELAVAQGGVNSRLHWSPEMMQPAQSGRPLHHYKRPTGEGRGGTLRTCGPLAGQKRTLLSVAFLRDGVVCLSG
ncbi:uncharacterized protein LOC119094295 [Pollicipes pollicipes]|uniref:uncharacterized protein LOC119094295 n=1 Tax=Pollicipes pollicipes TaxID=41117 RepID=UPI001884A661|nr:uncharacterized protein LOC119094295 [Pollicipes pollicipes]